MAMDPGVTIPERDKDCDSTPSIPIDLRADEEPAREEWLRGEIVNAVRRLCHDWQFSQIQWLTHLIDQLDGK